jgi:hypothetical protein
MQLNSVETNLMSRVDDLIDCPTQEHVRKVRSREHALAHFVKPPTWFRKPNCGLTWQEIVLLIRTDSEIWKKKLGFLGPVASLYLFFYRHARYIKVLSILGGVILFIDLQLAASGFHFSIVQSLPFLRYFPAIAGAVE